MKKLFVLSIASGYGGAERSIEVIARHLPPDIFLKVYAENPLHLAELEKLAASSDQIQVVKVNCAGTRWGRRFAAVRLIGDFLLNRPHRILVNTHSSALVAATAAKYLKNLGRYCHLYVRDFLWRDLDFIFQRLSRAEIITPTVVVTQRIGYLNPFYLNSFRTKNYSSIPDMVEIRDVELQQDGSFLHLATVNPWKGHADLMLALAVLKSRGVLIPIRSFGVVGDEALKVRLELLRHELGIKDRFDLEGYVSDPIPLLARCKAVVIPSVSHSGGAETFGRVAIEAWACKKPVIAYACGAMSLLIEDGVDGILVPEGDIDALAMAINKLEDSPALRQRLGEAGHAKVLKHYEANVVTRDLMCHLFSQRNVVS